MKDMQMENSLFRALNEAEWVKQVVQSCETKEQHKHASQLINLYMEKWGEVFQGFDLEEAIHWELFQLSGYQYRVIQTALDKPQGSSV